MGKPQEDKRAKRPKSTPQRRKSKAFLNNKLKNLIKFVSEPNGKTTPNRETTLKGHEEEFV